MTPSIAGELRKYRSLTVALIAGITVSVGMFVAFLDVDLTETRRELEVQAQLIALMAENRLSTAFNAVATDTDLLSEISPRAGVAAADVFRSIDALDPESLFIQVCVVGPPGTMPLLKRQPSLPCPVTPPGSDNPRATLNLPLHADTAMEIVPRDRRGGAADLLFSVPMDAERTATFLLDSARLIALPDHTVDRHRDDALQTCLFWTGGERFLPIVCDSTLDPDITEPGELASQSATAFSTRFDRYGHRWEIVSILKPNAVATSVSVYPIAALLFFLAATAAVCWFIFTTTDTNLRLNRQQRNLERAFAELREHNADLEQFAYMASHDLQSPIRHITSRATMVLEDLADGNYGEVERNTRVIEQAGERMHGFVLDLLEFCRAGEIPVQIAQVNLNNLVTRKLDELKIAKSIDELQADIRLLPTVRSDESKLAAVFQNVLSNAIKFSSAERALRIEIGATRDGDNKRWIIHVSDNGIGIEPQQFQRIFLPFKRLKQGGDDSGTGVGLSIAKKMIERIGGELWVESVPGRGSTFYFSIPDHYADLDPTEIGQARSQEADS